MSDFENKKIAIKARLKRNKLFNKVTVIGGIIMIILSILIQQLQGIVVGGIMLIIIGTYFYTKTIKLEQEVEKI